MKSFYKMFMIIFYVFLAFLIKADDNLYQTKTPLTIAQNQIILQNKTQKHPAILKNDTTQIQTTLKTKNHNPTPNPKNPKSEFLKYAKIKNNKSYSYYVAYYSNSNLKNEIYTRAP